MSWSEEAARRVCEFPHEQWRPVDPPYHAVQSYSATQFAVFEITTANGLTVLLEYYRRHSGAAPFDGGDDFDTTVETLRLSVGASLVCECYIEMARGRSENHGGLPGELSSKLWELSKALRRRAEEQARLEQNRKAAQAREAAEQSQRLEEERRREMLRDKW